MSQLKRDNHFISQGYLKNWGDEKNRIWTYQALVPRPTYPKWRRLPIGGVAYHRDFYTVIVNGQESDKVERWFDSEFETPAAEALQKVFHNKKLLPNDFRKLALYLAAQDVRTPSSYFEAMKRWKTELPPLLETTLKETVQELEEHHRDNQPILPKTTKLDFFDDIVNVSIRRESDENPKFGEIRAEISIGRKLWLRSIQYLLTKTSQVLLNHKWSIAQPAKGMSWFTSDHPVLRLNYYKDGKYDLRGGWGKNKGNILMPLSPGHLLFTQIGDDSPDYFSFSVEMTYEIQKFLSERAYRTIFAHKKLPSVERFRPRHINLEEYNFEEEQWKKWHQEQSSAEK